MEPATVGQAPKDVSANLPRAETPPAPSYMQQAQAAASQGLVSTTSAASAAAGAVASVLGGKKATGEETIAPGDAKGGKDGDAVAGDQINDEAVEGFLRGKYQSAAAGGSST